jgi:hypothetical protein
MTTTAARPVGQAATRETGVVLALARTEAYRIVRSPLLYLGLALSGLFSTGVFRDTESRDGWSGDEYAASSVMFVPLLIATAILVSAAFHRERDPVGTEAPTSSTARTVGILVGALPLVVLVGLLAMGLAAFVESVDGFDLGDEPGRTLHARFTAFELLQHVALAVLAVATGAAAGRRLASRATAALVVFAGWFPVMFVYWLFQVPAIVPFSIVQVQPVNVRVAPWDTDPLTFPSGWLLSAPGEFQGYWGRSFVSSGLAGWHDLWLLGLTCLFLATVFSGGWRRRLLMLGAVLSVVGIAAQYVVLP